VTPLDAEGNRGVPTTVSSFSWLWPSTTTPKIEDLQASPEVFDPKFSWDPVPGAARYEVEINSSVDFAPGSKVCCTGTTIATSLSPTTVFKDNVYYWRVRAFDPDGNAGVWNYWQDPDTHATGFTKTFDKGTPARDNTYPGPLVPGTYCFRVRARSDRAPGNQEVWGDYTYVQNGATDSSAPVGPAFTWSNYPAPADPGNSALCNTSYLCATD